MKVATKIKVSIGIVTVLAVGFIGFRVLMVKPREVEVIYKTVKPEVRRITTARFVERTSGTGTETQQERAKLEPHTAAATPVPETVPTVQSDDADIKEFQAWLSSILEQADTTETVERENFTAADDVIDYELERSVIKSVVQEQWGNSLEAYDIEGYMSAIWEADFFYFSDMGTPDNPDDDLIFRSGQQEREGTLKMFSVNRNIDLNLHQNGDIVFLSETLAMADYDYDLRLDSAMHGVSNPSGRMVFILERRDNAEWRILEWYDYATPDP